MIMELGKGGDLNRYMKKVGIMPEDEAREVI